MTNSRRTSRGPVKLMPGPGTGPPTGGFRNTVLGYWQISKYVALPSAGEWTVPCRTGHTKHGVYRHRIFHTLQITSINFTGTATQLVSFDRIILHILCQATGYAATCTIWNTFRGKIQPCPRKYSQFFQFCLIALASNNLHRLYRYITALPSFSVTVFVFHLYSLTLSYFILIFFPSVFIISFFVSALYHSPFCNTTLP